MISKPAEVRMVSTFLSKKAENREKRVAENEMVR